jgi:type IV secretory pathway VirJ component
MAYMDEDFTSKYMSGVPKSTVGQTFTSGNSTQQYTAAGLAEKLQNEYRQKLVDLQLQEFNVNKGVTLKNYEKGKAKTLSQIAQNAVSSGLSNTPILAQSEKGYESEVGDPMREGLAAQYASIQKGITEQNLQTELNKTNTWINEQENIFNQNQTKQQTQTYNQPQTQQTQQAQTGAQIVQSMNTDNSVFGGNEVFPQNAVSDVRQTINQTFYGDSADKPGNLISDAEWAQIQKASAPYKTSAYQSVSDIVKKSLGL